MSSVPFGILLISPFLSYKVKKELCRCLVFTLTLLAYTAYHLSRKPISVVKSVLHENCSEHFLLPLNESFHISQLPASMCGWQPFTGSDWSEKLGSLDVAYVFSYAVGMFFSGHVTERTSVRLFLTGGMLACGLTTAAFGAAYYLHIHSFAYFLCIQILAGFCQASGWPSVVTCMGNWFGKRRRGVLMGFWNMHTSLGNILGAVVAGLFVTRAWGLSFIVPGAIIAGMGIIVFLFLVPYPADVGVYLDDDDDDDDSDRIPPNSEDYCSSTESSPIRKKGSSPAKSDSFKKFLDQSEINPLLKNDDIPVKDLEAIRPVSIWRALKIPGVLEFALTLFFSKLVIYTFLFWLPTYIRHTGGFDPEQAADLSIVFDLGGIIGGVVAGILHDITGCAALISSSMLLLSAPLLYLYFMFGALSITHCIGLLVLLGIFVNGPYSLITTAVTADLGTHTSLAKSQRALAAVSGLIDGTGTLGAALGPLLCGLIMPSGWSSVFLMLIISTCCAALLLARLIIKEVPVFYARKSRKEYENLSSSDC